jgi:hypothetical protein
MKTQPTIVDSILKLMESSAPEAARAPAGSPHGRPQDGILSNLFATSAGHQESAGQPADVGESSRGEVQILFERLDRIEDMLTRLLQQRTVKDWYGTEEAAQILGKAEFTVREWCRLGRVRAQKRPCGRGRSREWMIAHSELERIQNEGLLPQPMTSTRIR